MYAGPFEKSADTTKEEKKVFKFDEKHIKTEKYQLDDHAFQEYGDGQLSYTTQRARVSEVVPKRRKRSIDSSMKKPSRARSNSASDFEQLKQLVEFLKD